MPKWLRIGSSWRRHLQSQATLLHVETSNRLPWKIEHKSICKAARKSTILPSDCNGALLPSSCLFGLVKAIQGVGFEPFERLLELLGVLEEPDYFTGHNEDTISAFTHCHQLPSTLRAKFRAGLDLLEEAEVLKLSLQLHPIGWRHFLCLWPRPGPLCKKRLVTDSSGWRAATIASLYLGLWNFLRSHSLCNFVQSALYATDLLTKLCFFRRLKGSCSSQPLGHFFQAFLQVDCLLLHHFLFLLFLRLRLLLLQSSPSRAQCLKCSGFLFQLGRFAHQSISLLRPSAG
mmetsp:Transcript_55767/g.103161  ORF Transcript_55767/g.103161 Transcript_55767/m.103161 type:complete len:288 (+) Transcript_55767:23-886(+)